MTVDHTQHTNINTTRKDYIVASVEISYRVAKQRVLHQQTKDHCTGFAQEGLCPVQ
jgi:hypothetical protein